MTVIGKIYFLFGLGALCALGLFFTEVYIHGENTLPKYHLYWLGFLALLPALFPWSMEKRPKFLVIFSFFWIALMWGAAWYFVFEIQGQEALIGILLAALSVSLVILVPVMHLGYKLKLLKRVAFLVAPCYVALMVWQQL